MASLWLNVVSNRPDNLGGPGRVFWTMSFDSEDDALDDAKSYPRQGRVYDTVYYVETVRHRVGAGFDLIGADEAHRRSLITSLPRVPA